MDWLTFRIVFIDIKYIVKNIELLDDLKEFGKEGLKHKSSILK